MRGPRVALFTVCPLNRYARAHAPGNHTASGAPNSAATLIAAGVAALGRCAKGSLRECSLRERRAPATCGYECDRIPRSRPTRIGILRDFERSSGKKPPWISSALGRNARAGSKGAPRLNAMGGFPTGLITAVPEFGLLLSSGFENVFLKGPQEMTVEPNRRTAEPRDQSVLRRADFPLATSVALCSHHRSSLWSPPKI